VSPEQTNTIAFKATLYRRRTALAELLGARERTNPEWLAQRVHKQPWSGMQGNRGKILSRLLKRPVANSRHVNGVRAPLDTIHLLYHVDFCFTNPTILRINQPNHSRRIRGTTWKTDSSDLS
jgi:hypothetical protein